MNPRLSSLSLVALAAAALPLSAQTAAKPATHVPVHRTATASSATGGGCLTLPAISPKVPALPAGSSCPKPLYTITRRPELQLDYVSPMVGPAVRELLGAQPTTISLGYVDTKIGTGALAQPGKWYTVHYTGYLASDGSKFDSSVDRNKPISFPYGQHRVIPGWDTGFEGMHIGGKRRLFIPYQLAYGDSGRAPIIPAKAMLIFDMELVAQNDADPDAPKTPPTPPAPPARPQAEPQSENGKPTVPEAKPTQSPAGAAATPPVNSSTPAASTQPATRPESK